MTNIDVATRMIESFDGVELAVHEMGEGRPVVLIHGLFSNADTNWIKYGHARQLADAGFRVIMPDLRTHGQSAAPQGAESYPAHVLARDMRCLIEKLDLADYDLGGFSLGARTVLRLLSDGLKPRRAIVAGMGLQGLTAWHKRREFFVDMIDRRDELKRGDDAWLALQFMKTMDIDPMAARHLLCAVEDADIDFSAIDMPVLVLCGRDDRDNGDPVALADKLSHGRMEWIEGTHMSCVTDKALGAKMRDFLSD